MNIKVSAAAMVAVSAFGLASARANPVDPELDKSKPSEWFAKAVSAAVGAPVTAGLDHGVPNGIVVMLQKFHPTPSRNPNLDANAQIAVFQRLAAKFDPLWAAYEARKKIVAAALDASAKAEQGGDLPGAVSALQAVISPPPKGWPSSWTSSFTYVTTEGRSFTPRRMDSSPSRKGFLIPEDAELDAAAQLALLEAKQQDYAGAAEACFLETTRRRVRDEADERLLWLAGSPEYHQLTPPHGLQELLTAGNAIQDYADQRVTFTMDEAAHGCFQGIVESAKLQKVDIGKLGAVKKGDWIAVAFTPTSWKDTGPVYAEHRKGNTAFNCHDTDHLTAITPSGSLVYAQQCQFKPYTVDVDVAVALAAQPPQHPDNEVIVIGKVAATGKKAKLSDARVIPSFFDRDVELPKQ